MNREEFTPGPEYGNSPSMEWCGQYVVIRPDFRAPDMDSSYETLMHPSSGWSATITDPEDRTFNRDLWPIVERLAEVEGQLARSRELNNTLVEALKLALVEEGEQ